MTMTVTPGANPSSPTPPTPPTLASALSPRSIPPTGTTRARGATDAHGNPVSGPTDAVASYDAAVDRLLRYHPDVITEMGGLVEQAPEFPMGQVLAGYLALTSTDAPDVAAAGEASGQLDHLVLNQRETAHRDVLRTWVGGDWHGAARRLDDLLVGWPTDLLALLVGHQLDFFVGDAQNLRDRVARSLPALDPAHPHRGFVRGMLAFGLEESGHYEEAEAHGLAALEANRDDVWGVHAVAHAHEMRGRVDDGIRFMRSREADWGDGNLFAVHNWWHLALYLLEAERSEEAIAIYDAHVHNAASDGVPLEMLDASALLWRLLLDGIDTGSRFDALADAWATRTQAEPWYAFNDLHAVMAFAGAGRLADAGAVVDRLARYVASDGAGGGGDGGGGGGGRAPSPIGGRVGDRVGGGLGAAGTASNLAMTAEIGLPACRAVLAHVEGRHDDVLDALVPIRSTLQRFGGSHAQRDVLQRTIVASAIGAGRLDLARSLLHQRLTLRETSVWSLRQLAAVLQRSGDGDGADGLDAVADGHRDRFAAAG